VRWREATSRPAPAIVFPSGWGSFLRKLHQEKVHASDPHEPADSTDPKLGTLGNYGGPTQTIRLLSGSPAIDTGDPSGCSDAQGRLLTTDQRGYPRPDKEDTSSCDRGAYESQSDSVHHGCPRANHIWGER
jgi:hypothetical protein